MVTTVTSENREQFIADELAKKAGTNEKMADPQLYEHYSKKAEEFSTKAKDNMSHYDAMNAHKHAAMYAKPHPKYKEHEEKAKHHAKEMRAKKRAEQESKTQSYMENRDKSQTKSLVKKGILSKAE